MGRRSCRGTFELPLQPEEALPLFTPTGERSWAPGWDPRFPAGVVEDDTEPGTVFVTDADGRTTVWVVTERRPRGFTYTRVAVGSTAGHVTVTCREYEGGTTVEVRYDLSPLSEEGERCLSAFEEGYDAYLESWRDAILDALTR